MEASEGERRFPGWLLGLAALLVAVRGLAILSLADVFVYAEELEKGAAGKALLDGIDVERYRLAYHYYEGGGFVVAHLNALAFRLVGQNLLAHKLVALAFALVLLVAGARLVQRLFGRTSAVLFGLLVVFAPESFQKLSLLNLGIHYQALVFAVLVLGATARIVLLDGGTRGTWLALGLFGGFGLYFDYQVAVTLAFALGAIAVRRSRELVGPGAGLALVGFALGSAPLWTLAMRVGGRVLDVHGQGLFAGGGGGLASTLGDFAASVLGQRPALDLVGLGLWSVAVIAGAVAALAARDTPGTRGRALFVALFGATFGAVYLVSGFATGTVHHYVLLGRLSQPWLALTILVAAGLPRGLQAERPGVRGAAWALVAALLALGARDSLRIAWAGRPASPGSNLELLRTRKGTSYPQYFGKVRAHLDGDAADKLRVLSGFDEPHPVELRAALGMALPEDVSIPLEDVIAFYRSEGGESWRELLLGLGPQLTQRHGVDLAANLARAAALPEDLRELALEGLGRWASGRHPTADVLRAEVEAALAAGAPDAFFRGLGHRLLDGTPESATTESGTPAPYHRRRAPPFLVDPDGARALLAELPVGAAAPMAEGFERALERRSLP